MNKKEEIWLNYTYTCMIAQIIDFNSLHVGV